MFMNLDNLLYLITLMRLHIELTIKKVIIKITNINMGTQGWVIQTCEVYD